MALCLAAFCKRHHCAYIVEWFGYKTKNFVHLMAFTITMAKDLLFFQVDHSATFVEFFECYSSQFSFHVRSSFVQSTETLYSGFVVRTEGRPVV